MFQHTFQLNCKLLSRFIGRSGHTFLDLWQYLGYMPNVKYGGFVKIKKQLKTVSQQIKKYNLTLSLRLTLKTALVTKIWLKSNHTHTLYLLKCKKMTKNGQKALLHKTRETFQAGILKLVFTRNRGRYNFSYEAKKSNYKQIILPLKLKFCLGTSERKY